MKEHDKFISTYKEIENLVRNICQDSSPMIYLEEKYESEAQKIRLCRIIRNYIQHNNDYESYIKITPSLQKFLEGLKKEVELSLSRASEIMTPLKKAPTINYNNKLYETVNYMNKKKVDCVFCIKNGDVVGLFDNSSIRKALSSPITKTTKINDYLINKKLKKVDINDTGLSKTDEPILVYEEGVLVGII